MLVNTFKPSVRVKFLFSNPLHDWYYRYISQVLQDSFELILTDDPDFIFCAAHEEEHLKYSQAVKIAIAAENVRIDFNYFDYGLGFDYLNFEDRYLRFPLYMFYEGSVEAAARKHVFPVIIKKIRFCNFIVSNGNSDEKRVQFYQALSNYKKVDSGGRYLNNIGEPVNDKIAFQQTCKFSICFENSSTPGYLTEKLIQAAAAQTIPIYWGDNKAGLGLTEGGGGINPKSFIHVKTNDSFEGVIERIKEIDQNDELFCSVLREPLFSDINHIELFKIGLYEFLNNIFSQPKSAAFRRGNGQTRIAIENRQIQYYQHRSGKALVKELIFRFRNKLIGR